MNMTNEKQYVAYVSTAYYFHSKPGYLDWAEEEEVKTVVIAKADTFEECKEKAFKECEGSRWAMYPSLFIEEPGGGEIYSDVVVYDKCKCCGHEKYDRIVSDVSKLIGK